MTPDPFAHADRENAERAKRHALERHAREREARRQNLAADDLELFNPNRRGAADLFRES